MLHCTSFIWCVIVIVWAFEHVLIGPVRVHSRSCWFGMLLIYIALLAISVTIGSPVWCVLSMPHECTSSGGWAKLTLNPYATPIAIPPQKNPITIFTLASGRLSKTTGCSPNGAKLTTLARVCLVSTFPPMQLLLPWIEAVLRARRHVCYLYYNGGP